MIGERYVEPLSLGQPQPVRDDRISADGTMGIWRKPGWLPDPRAFRCGGCKGVVPWSLWSRAQQEAFRQAKTVPERCPGCEG